MQSLVEAARAEIARAANIEELEQIRVRLLGKKGEITAQLKSLGAMDPEARKAAGAKINEAKEALTTALDARRAELENEQLAAQLASDTVDVTLPGRGQSLGGLHPVTRARRRIEQIFRGGGFTVADGPEIEDDWHNFEALNIPADHPARAMHDTFYFGDGRLLRTHTSPVQVRYLQAHTAAGAHHRAGSRLSQRLRHDAHADVPPGRRAGRRRGHQLREPEGSAARVHAGVLREGRRHAAASFVLPVHRAVRRSRYLLRRLRRHRAAACARTRAGSKSRAAASCIRTCCGP